MNSIQADLTESQAAELKSGPLFNDDLAPVPEARRKWGLASFAALWISMSACIPTYMLASSLIGGGMNWWEAVLTIFLGNLIVLVPMILNAHAGTKYGIPFPVYCRAAFGTLGANIPALLRAPTFPFSVSTVNSTSFRLKAGSGSGRTIPVFFLEAFSALGAAIVFLTLSFSVRTLAGLFSENTGV